MEAPLMGWRKWNNTQDTNSMPLYSPAGIQHPKPHRHMTYTRTLSANLHTKDSPTSNFGSPFTITFTDTHINAHKSVSTLTPGDLPSLNRIQNHIQSATTINLSLSLSLSLSLCTHTKDPEPPLPRA
ncbi:hypothetical protein GOP47_0020341 [Adiantum capillus-veneris]|uniref:Uncharacterized protein n=1 Tax=Adiantum capillus-veneris TaxID=13818 RepID=A0A9D4UCV2_ADICA|nr:hypothetical protein GOP47_0020341 [Adiantum capillus-veneris]